MKKIIAIIFLLITIIIGCSSCDHNSSYDYAILKLPNGEIVEGEVESYTDWIGTKFVIKIDGTEYFCDISNCVLINN